ncbi:DNase I-like protein [Hypomontagnella submonticulosa]|nr:DNase I-like protein [Hypomontagnella submonticulosa]
MEELPIELNIITLNCWGLLHLSAHRAERLAAIGRELAAADPPPHIVALQECWTQEDYRSIRRETRFALPFGKFYYGGIFGTGLAILSRWPIEESSMYRYPLNGRPTAFFRGDWFVGKGVACARIRYGTGDRDIVEVFNTHTHAIYEHPPKHDSYEVHRLAQCWEMAKLVRGAAERGHLAVALGDFNDVPGSLSYRMLTAHSPIRDAWRVLSPDSSLGSAAHELERARRRPIPSAEFNIAENGVTSNSAYNTWSWSKSEQRTLRSGKRPMIIPPDTPDPRGKRIDYIFFSPQVSSTPGPAPGPLNEARASRDISQGSRTKGWVVKDVRVGMLARHPELGCSLSDHFSVEATLLLHSSTNTFSPSRPPSSPPSPTSPHKPANLHPDDKQDSDGPEHAASLLALEHGTYLQSPTGSEFRVGSRLDLGASHDAQLRDSALASTARRGDGLDCTTYDEILALIHACGLRELSQRRWRIAHFFAWAVVVVACYVGIWFVGRWPGVGFAFLVLSSLGFLAGVLDGLVGLLFFGSEVRALAEFEWEIMNAKATASGAHGLLAQQHHQRGEDDGAVGGGSAGGGGGVEEKAW